jgi:hydrogenase expression/formation protein HypC
MCLAVPGKVIKIREDGEGPTGRIGTVDLQGNQLEASLAMTPEAGVGDWVLVHAGYAISVLDEAEARDTWEYIEFENLGQMPAELRGDGKDTDG